MHARSALPLSGLGGAMLPPSVPVCGKQLHKLAAPMHCERPTAFRMLQPGAKRRGTEVRALTADWPLSRSAHGSGLCSLDAMQPMG